MVADVSGREPVQIAEIIQPKCGNVYGVAPCTASGPDARRCFNTRATCQDIPNFRSQPESLLSTDFAYDSGETGTDAFTLTADFFAAIDVRFFAASSGVIFQIGNATSSLYVGITSGELVFRAGDASVVSGVNVARLAVAMTDFNSLARTLLVSVDVSAGTLTAWSYDSFRREIEAIGTATATSGFPSSQWAASDDYGVATLATTAPVGESADDFEGAVFQARAYDSTSAPDMDTTFSIPLRFARGNVVDTQVPGLNHVIPSLNSISTVPTSINLSGSDPDKTGLGNRAKTTFRFQDHPHSDRVVDPYLSGRNYDPLDRGSFWSKWFVRNRFRYNLPMIVYEGYAGQSLSEMVSRSYLMTSTSGPTESGAVTIQGKDILTQVEERKAQYPVASPGELQSDTPIGATEIDIVGATVDDYPAPGTVRINDELIQYTTVTAEAGNVTRLSGLTRASDNSTEADHDEEDKVQLCVRYTSQTVDAIVSDLLRNGAGVDPGFFNAEQAASERDRFLAAYVLDTLITEPTGVVDLLSELQEQVGFYIWWDERDALINFRAIRGFDENVPMLNDTANFIENSFSVTDKPRSRISQVWFNYGIRTPVANLEETASYQRVLVQADLPSETVDQYGEPSIRQIFSRWINSAALALGTASRIVVRYSTIPRQCRFRLDAKDRSLWVGDSVRISHFLEINQFGERLANVWTILSAEEIVPGETIEYIAEDTTLFGRISLILPTGEPDYDPDTSPFTGAFIGDNNGLLSDGTPSARIT